MEKPINPGSECLQSEVTSSQETSLSRTSSFDEADYDKEQDKLICLMCGFRSNQLGRHITGSHKIPTQDYKDRFPGARIGRLAEDQIAKMVRSKRNKDTRHKRYLQEKAVRAEELKEAGFEPIKCRLCDYESMSSIISHITNKHNIELNSYREMFPGSTVQRWSPSQKKKMSEIMSQDEKVQKLLEVRSYPSEVKHWLRKGYSEAEAQELVSQYQKKTALKQNNPETKAKQSARTKGANNPMSLMSIASRHDIEKEEARKLTPCYGRRGKKHPMYGKHHTPESLAKISKNASRHFSQRSNAEREIYEELIAMGYNVSRNVGVSRYKCDIVFDSMPFIVEYFGDFWHCNPEKWDAQQFNSRIKMTAEKRWALDGDKLASLESLGYKVLVVWESNWKRNPQGVIKEIIDASNSVSRQG